MLVLKPDPTFAERVLAGISAGAVAAVVGAGLGAVTEPVVNQVLVSRVTLPHALKTFNWPLAWNHFYAATLPTNLLKFPFFEAINVIVSRLRLPATGRGAITGAIFTTLTLPLGNYRFCRSLNLPVDLDTLYRAYWPTLLRDVIYGIVRTNVSAWIDQRFPLLKATPRGRFAFFNGGWCYSLQTMFCTALVACLLSSPGNELRGYYLQPADRRQGFKEFFHPDKYVRSTLVGATNLALSLAAGTLIVEPVQSFLSGLRAACLGPVVAVGSVDVVVVNASR